MSELIIHKENGKIINRVALKLFFENLSDGKYLLTAKNIKKRSLLQNSYYWACVVPLIKDALYEAGYNEVKTNDDCHEVLKHLFLKRKIVNERTDETIEIAGSTTKLTTTEFKIYLEEIYKWSAEYLGINIPAPGEPIPMFNE